MAETLIRGSAAKFRCQKRERSLESSLSHRSQRDAWEVNAQDASLTHARWHMHATHTAISMSNRWAKGIGARLLAKSYKRE